MGPSKLIGILTIGLGIVSLYFGHQLIVNGMWVSFDADSAWYLAPSVYYYGLIVPTAGLVIGIAALRNKSWVLRSNPIFQIISIGVILVMIVSVLTITFTPLSASLLVSLAISSVILYLSSKSYFEPKTEIRRH